MSCDTSFAISSESLSSRRLGGVDVHESEAASKNEYLTDLDREEDETAKLAGGEVRTKPLQCVAGVGIEDQFCLCAGWGGGGGGPRQAVSP